jgi:uncharacterized protein YaiE (UPF0345 family)
MVFISNKWDVASGKYVTAEMGRGTTIRAEVDTQYKIMSDIYGCATHVLYWDDEADEPRRATVNATEEYYVTLPKSVVVDATPEVIEKYRQYSIDREYTQLLAEAQNDVSAVVKGCRVRVIKGVKVKIGTEGKVVVMKEGQYGMSVAIATSDEMIEVVKNGRTYQNNKDVEWTYLKNIERIDPGKVNYVALVARATEIVDNKLRSA